MALIYHPDLPDRDPVEVPDRHVALWAERGWLEVDEDQAPADSGPQPPSSSASKADWVAYAVSQGVSEENAKGATKDELVARFGA